MIRVPAPPEFALPAAWRARFVLPAALVLLAPALHAAGAPAGAAGNSPLLKLGRFEVRPHLSYSLQYEEGVLTSPGDADSTFVESFSPGVLVLLGQKLTADYSADVKMYSGGGFQDSIDHDLQVSVNQPVAGAMLTGSQSVSLSSRPSLETGRQTEILAVVSSLSGGLPVGNKLSLVGSVNQSLQFVKALPDSSSWNGNASASYNSGRSWVASAGITSGYSAVYKSPDTFFIGPQVSLNWQPAAKFSLALSGSLNDREILGGTRDRQLTPAYNVGATYSPFSHTSVGFTGNRTDSPSLLGGQSLESTQFGVSLQQRLLGRLRTNLGFTYGLSKFITTVEAGPPSRRDDLYTYQVGVSLPVVRRGSVSLDYQRSINASNAPGFDTDSTSIGFSASYRY